jgi:hypothetical protein
MSFKPLVKISQLKQEVYLPNAYAFTAAETAKIKKYLPKVLNFTGIDAANNIEANRQELEKEKLKLKSILGNEVNSNQALKFSKKEELNMKIWEDVAICINIPFNNRQNAEDEKVLH